MSYLLELRKQFIKDKIKPIITEPGREIINQAIEDGKTVIIATATNDFVTRPIADLFNVRTLIATEFEVINQKFTGKVLNTPCFREGKVSKVKKWDKKQTLTFFIGIKNICSTFSQFKTRHYIRNNS